MINVHPEDYYRIRNDKCKAGARALKRRSICKSSNEVIGFCCCRGDKSNATMTSSNLRRPVIEEISAGRASLATIIPGKDSTGGALNRGLGIASYHTKPK